MRAERSFPPASSSVRAARHFATDALAELDDETLEVVALMVSELATNSVRHARTGFRVEVEQEEGRVRVSVVDGDETEPRRRVPERGEPTGRGLLIVDRFSDRWGV